MGSLPYILPTRLSPLYLSISMLSHRIGHEISKGYALGQLSTDGLLIFLLTFTSFSLY